MQGVAGVGVPVGGTAGQVLAKIDNANFNTEWVTPSGGGAILQTTLTVATVTTYSEHVVTVSGVVPTSKVLCSLSPTTDEENDIASISDDSINLYAVPGTGNITFVLTSAHRFVGPFTINYQAV